MFLHQVFSERGPRTLELNRRFFLTCRNENGLLYIAPISFRSRRLMGHDRSYHYISMWWFWFWNAKWKLKWRNYLFSRLALTLSLSFSLFSELIFSKRYNWLVMTRAVLGSCPLRWNIERSQLGILENTWLRLLLIVMGHFDASRLISIRTQIYKKPTTMLPQCCHPLLV